MDLVARDGAPAPPWHWGVSQVLLQARGGCGASLSAPRGDGYEWASAALQTGAYLPVPGNETHPVGTRGLCDPP